MKYLTLLLLFNFSFSQVNNKSFFKNKIEKSEDITSRNTQKKFFKPKKDLEIVAEIKEYETKLDTQILDKDSLRDSLSEVEKIKFSHLPVENSRITSGYSKKRFHPVLQKWQEHNGTDFAAPYGSSIKATAGGVVEITGYTNGNGNYVKIKHNETYSTQYLHMSEILVSEGEKIILGQEIGLVGTSGLATGPHVCYRFWKDGIQVDPFNLDFEEEKSKTQKTKNKSIPEVVLENKNENEFKEFVSGFFKKKS